MRKLQNIEKSLNRARFTNRILAIGVILAITAIGYILIAAYATTSYDSVEVEDASLVTAARITDASASGGFAIQFVQKNTNGGSEDGPVIGVNCIDVPSSCGYPDATNTGVPIGVSLKASGSLNITQAGAVIEGMDVQGCIDVNAPNVMIKNSKVTCGRSSASIRIGSDGSAIIQDTEINGAGTAGNCVGSARFTLLRVNLYNCTDGVRANGTNDTEPGVVIRDSYLHDLARVPDSHNDTIQTTQTANVLIEHNTLFPYKKSTNDFMNAAYIIAQDQGAVANVIVRNNLVNGGNYTFMIGTGLENVVFQNNVFGRNFRYGPVSGSGKALVDSTNVYFDTGLSVYP